MAIRRMSRGFRPLLSIIISARPQRIFNASNSFPSNSRRAASRQTTIKVDDLPQLPQLPQGALPEIEKDGEPQREYPMVLQQHRNNMLKFKDCVVLTRVGDFYEIYFEHVEQYAPLLGLKSAKRSTTLGPVPMAGFQHSQLERYVKMLVMDHDKHVAIAEQIPIPDHERTKMTGSAKFDRKVTRVITPGTLIDESFVDSQDTNFLLAIDIDESLRTSQSHDSIKDILGTSIGLAWVDLANGDFNVQQSTLQALPAIVARVSPREIVLDRSLESYGTRGLTALLGDGRYALSFHNVSNRFADPSTWSPMLEQNMAEPHGLQAHEINAGGIVLDYVSQRLIDAKIKLQRPVSRQDSEFMSIDKQSLRALEIKSTIRDNLKQGSLLQTIRRTVTNGGARLLSQRIVSPAMIISVINQRLDLAENMLNYSELHDQIVTLLKNTSDTSRLLQKFSMSRGDADDLLGIAKTIKLTQAISDTLQRHALHQEDQDSTSAGNSSAESRMRCIWDILHRLDLEAPMKVAEKILESIDEEELSKKQTLEVEQAEQAESLANEVVTAEDAGQAPPKLARRMSRTNASSVVPNNDDIWILKSRSSTVLHEAHRAYQQLVDETAKLTADLRSRLAADSLTLRYTPNHGHYCHVKGKDLKAALGAIDGVRIITTTKTTRTFLAPEWVRLGSRLDSARQRIRQEEERVFGKLRGHVLENLVKLRRNAAVLDELDVASSSAIIARERSFVRPLITDSTVHKIIGGRHPTVDVGLRNQGKLFTSNDCFVGDRDSIYFITGPNMAGKSTFLRQNALITILAQTGSFVPAEYAEIGLVDKVFSRVGSADSLYHDQSTFMVEMLETAEILKQATDRSFVIMDEIGRGTTPQDGVAVGYACLHHLRYVNNCRALFATHFHTLADMTAEFGSIGYYCTDVAEEADGSWMYIHKLQEGINRDSHALKVARLAGLPEAAIITAGQVLDGMHNQQRLSKSAAVAG